jgi:hypothetical protein
MFVKLIQTASPARRGGSECHAFILLTLASSGCEGDLADTVQRRDNIDLRWPILEKRGELQL